VVQLLGAGQLQLAFEAYTNSGKTPIDSDRPEITRFALQEAVAELMVKHNRILWQAVQQSLLKQS